MPKVKKEKKENKSKPRDFSCCKSTVFRIKAMAYDGAHIDDAIQDCINFAKTTKCEVTLNFNGVDLYIRDYHTIESQKKVYDEAIDRMIENFEKSKKNA